MPDESEVGYRNFEIRGRIETVNEKVIKMEGRQDGHEILCAQRYNEILKQFVEMNTKVTQVSKTGFIIAVILFLLELGRATIPTVMDLLTKGIH